MRGVCIFPCFLSVIMWFAAYWVKKVGAFEVGVHDVFIAFWRGFEYVGAYAGGNAGVVDEHVEATKGVECGIHEAFAVFYAGYVALTNVDVLPAFSNTCCGFFCGCLDCPRS